MNCVRSAPDTSAKHCTNCSMVAASPSWRAEKKVLAFLEIFWARRGGKHATGATPLLIDGRGIEIVDLAVDGGSHGMRERTCILDELVRAQAAHVADALDRARALIGRKLLIAKNRESFLEAELEPIAAGDAVAGPI